MASTELDEDDYELDPVFINSKRETIVIISLFLFFMFWSACISFLLGHQSNFLTDDPNDLSLLMGMPSWVFYGVFLPWMLVNAIGVWFCFGFMQNDDLDSGSSADPKSSEETP